MFSCYKDIHAVLPVVLTFMVMTGGCGITGSERDGERQRDTTGPDPEVFPTDRTPAWSPSGSRIAYHHDAGGTEDTTDVSGLYILNLETDSTRLLVEGSARSPDWRPDGERIVFTVGDIFTVQPDGSDLQRVTNHGSASFPSWAPGGTRLAYDATSLPRKGIWLVNPDGSGRKHLGLGRDPDWSTQGRSLLYEGPPGASDSASQLWNADTSATDSTQLTNNAFVNNRDPAWSPDGEWIAWSPGTDDGLAVSVMRADGGGKKRLVEPPAAEASWAPDSERLVFIKPDPETGRTALWTIRRDGSDLRQITDPSRNPLN